MSGLRGAARWATEISLEDSMTGPDYLALGPALAVVACRPATVLPEPYEAPLRAAGLIEDAAGLRGVRLSGAGREWWDGRTPEARALFWSVGRELLAAHAEGRDPNLDRATLRPAWLLIG